MVDMMQSGCRAYDMWDIMYSYMWITHISHLPYQAHEVTNIFIKIF